MKKKVFSIFFALVLVCSFSLVTAVPAAADPLPAEGTTCEIVAGEYYPVNFTVTDDGPTVTWTFDMIGDKELSDLDKTGGGRWNYGLAISLDGVQPAFQIHNNDGTDNSFAVGTHLYSPYLNEWVSKTTNTLVAELDWVTCTGDAYISPGEYPWEGGPAAVSLGNPDGIFTVTIDKANLAPEFYWAIWCTTSGFSGGGKYSSYPGGWGWSSLVSGYVEATIPRPAEVWVDDGYTDVGNNDGHIWGWDAFALIQDGIDAVAGSIVNVAPGTYDEALVIDKSLTIQGAGKADTVVDADGAQYGINICSGAVLDSVTIKDLTVKNASNSNITIRDGSLITSMEIENLDLSGSDPVGPDHWSGLFVQHSTVNTLLVKGCTFENIRLFGVRVDSGGKVGHLKVIDSDFSGESEDAGFFDGVWNQAGIESCGNIDDLTVSDSTFTGTVNGIRLFWHWSDGTTTRYSIEKVDIEGSTFEGTDAGFFFYIRDTAPSGYEIGDIQIHDCSFTDNEWGIKFSAPEAYDDVVIDATLNWWGHASGPGDAISSNIDAEPWLLTEGGEPYDRTVALNPGWSIVSPDAELLSWTAVDAEKLKYAYDEGGFRTDFTLDAVTPMFIKTVDGGGIGFNYATDSQGIFTTDLEAGWNLIGIPETGAGAEAILSSIRLGVNNEVALATLASQGNYNPSGVTFYESMLNIEDVPPEVALHPNDGYWAYMNVAKEFGVIVVPDGVE